MKCPKYQVENLVKRKLCRKCGSKIALICPECKFENILGEYGYDKNGKRFVNLNDAKIPL